MIWKMTEWKSASGRWYCNCVDDLAGSAGLWYTPARILDLTPATYIQYVIDNFKPDHISVDKEKCLVFFSWDSQTNCRRFKNFINAEARKKNFQV